MTLTKENKLENSWLTGGNLSLNKSTCAACAGTWAWLFKFASLWATGAEAISEGSSTVGNLFCAQSRSGLPDAAPVKIITRLI